MAKSREWLERYVYDMTRKRTKDLGMDEMRNLITQVSVKGVIGQYWNYNLNTGNVFAFDADGNPDWDSMSIAEKISAETGYDARSVLFILKTLTEMYYEGKIELRFYDPYKYERQIVTQKKITTAVGDKQKLSEKQKLVSTAKKTGIILTTIAGAAALGYLLSNVASLTGRK